MQIRLLGPVEVVTGDGSDVPVAGARLRSLIAALALEAGRAVAAPALVDSVWGESPPADAANALQTLVSRVRRLLGPDAVAQAGPGYRLAVEPDDVDALRFERLLVDGTRALRDGDPGTAAGLLDAALALWRGAALEGAGEELHARGVRLDELRLDALAGRVDAALELGDAATQLPLLESAAAEHPLDERLGGRLVRALATAGRAADALRAYERLRASLVDELGVDPAPDLQDLHLRLLRGEVGTPPPPTRQRRTNLKAALTSFVGREDDVARIGKLLEQNRLVTLVGPGGAGKTRLATESAGRILDTAGDGVWLAELAAVTSDADVAPAVLGSVGLRDVHTMDRRSSDARDAAGRLTDALADKRVVLLLDNCEHVIDASARLAEHLLGDCPELRVLATSREPLGIVGEVIVPVVPLSHPSSVPSAAEALEYPAVRLFADRAAAVRPDFDVDDRTVGAVLEIVERLDGLPLAIELAAARLRAMPVEEIARRLGDRFRLLTGGSRTALPRHRTLRAVVDWSWELLTPVERAVAENLAVFPGGITIDSATAVRPDAVAADDVPEVIAALVDKSLLQSTGTGRRMRMLETIREYATDRLAERGELEAARTRHADHFAGLLKRAEPHLTTAGQLPWFELLGAERENVLAALRHRCDCGDADGALRIAVGLAGYAMLVGDHTDIHAWLADALAVPGGTESTTRLAARGLRVMGAAAVGGRSSSPEELRALADEIGRHDIHASPLLGLLRPALAFFAGDEALATRYAEDSLEIPDPWVRASVRMFLASMAENSGDVPRLRREAETALGEFRALGERWGTAGSLRLIAQVRTLDGDLDAAAEAYEESLALTAEMRSTEDEAMMYGQLADLALRRGDEAAARRHIERARRSAESAGNEVESILVGSMLAALEHRVGNDALARQLSDDAIAKLRTVPTSRVMQGHFHAIVLGFGAAIRVETGALDDARAILGEAYTASVGTSDQPIIATVALVVADLAAVDGNPVDAARILGAAARLRGSEDPTAESVARLTERLRETLGDAAFAAAYDAGRALDKDAAVAAADPVAAGVVPAGGGAQARR